MASILLYLFIATTFWNPDMNVVGAKVDSIKDNANVSTNTHEGKTHRETHDLENYAWKSSLSELQLIQANEDVITHRAAWVHFKGSYIGLQATLNVHRLPGVGHRQMSSSSITIANLGSSSMPSKYSGLQAGWHVAPALYGDTEPHFYIYSKQVQQQAGCYNLQCGGFVCTNSKVIMPGSRISPVSEYNGPQYEITVTISQDPVSGDWWVRAGKSQEVPVGYWPKSLYPDLAKGAGSAQCGGVVTYPKGEKGPPMGSGHFPKEGSKKAAYMKDVMVRTNDQTPSSPSAVEDKKDCYKVGPEMSNVVYFGGPGGCIN